MNLPKNSRWTVIGDDGTRSKGGKILYFCECECGRTSHVTRYDLTSGKSTKCLYCAGMEKGYKHGLAGSKIYYTYWGAKLRCTNENYIRYDRYGGRGIEFRFKSIEDFIDAIGWPPSKNHTLDRINNDGHYEKGNVRWATWSEQALNRGVV
jgi:hypothetical protein